MCPGCANEIGTQSLSHDAHKIGGQQRPFTEEKRDGRTDKKAKITPGGREGGEGGEDGNVASGSVSSPPPSIYCPSLLWNRMSLGVACDHIKALLGEQHLLFML